MADKADIAEKLQQYFKTIFLKKFFSSFLAEFDGFGQILFLNCTGKTSESLPRPVNSACTWRDSLDQHKSIYTVFFGNYT